MELFVDTNSLNAITKKLDQEISQYKNSIDKIYRELDLVYLYWSGTRYQDFMDDVTKNRATIENSYSSLNDYSSLVKNALVSYNSLTHGVHYE